jgi:hypothetical protein
MPIIPVLGRLRQVDLKFEASLGYTTRLYLKKKKKRERLLSHTGVIGVDPDSLPCPL